MYVFMYVFIFLLPSFLLLLLLPPPPPPPPPPPSSSSSSYSSSSIPSISSNFFYFPFLFQPCAFSFSLILSGLSIYSCLQFVASTDHNLTLCCIFVFLECFLFVIWVFVHLHVCRKQCCVMYPFLFGHKYFILFLPFNFMSCSDGFFNFLSSIKIFSTCKKNVSRYIFMYACL